MKASITAIKDTSVSFGELVLSLFTLMLINAILIVPAALVIREFLGTLNAN